MAAEALYQTALALDPYDADALNSYGYMLLAVGQVKKALPIRQELDKLEPLIPNCAAGTVNALWLAGDRNAALEVAQRFTNVPGIQRIVARIYAADGRYGDAADALHLTASGAGPLAKQDQAAARLLRMAEKRGSISPAGPELGQMSFAYHYVGADDHILDFNERNAARGFSLGAATLAVWDPAYATVRRSERFKMLVRKQGLYDYWRAKGWPEWCHPTTGDDFECN